MEDVVVGQYRTHDQPKNLSIKVTFSNVTPAQVVPSAQLHSLENVQKAGESIELQNRSNVNVEEKEEVVIQWQEKLFSEKEFEFYQDPLNCENSLQRKYHDDVQELLQTFGGRINKRIFTYTDSDNLSSVEPLKYVTSSPDEFENVLTLKMKNLKLGAIRQSSSIPSLQVGLRKRKSIINYEPTENFKSNHVLTTPRKVMKVMVDLGQRESGELVIEDERILCEVQLDANGSLVLKPDINKKETYTLETNYDVRRLYQYTLENVSKQMSADEEAQEKNLVNELYARHQHLMLSQIGNEFYPTADANHLFVYNFIEIEAARNFEYDNLYVQYLLELPDGWSCADPESLYGVTQNCERNKDGVAYFSFPVDFQLLFEFTEETLGNFMTWPVLFLQVYSLDSWQRYRIEGYGYCSLPDVPGSTRFQVDMWRPSGNDMFSEVRRYFIGGSPELDDPTYVYDSTKNHSQSSVEESKKLNRFFFKTITTGNVILKMNTAFQRSFEKESLSSGQSVLSKKWKKAFKRNTGAFAAAVDSLTRVFDAFQKARKRMLAARANLPRVGNGE